MFSQEDVMQLSKLLEGFNILSREQGVDIVKTVFMQPLKLRRILHTRIKQWVMENFKQREVKR